MSPFSRPPLEVVCAIIVHNGYVLAARRSATMTHPLMWEFPGGKIDRGESAHDATIREIREELGATVTPHATLSPVLHTYPHRTIRLTPVLCSIDNPDTVIAHEHDAIEWLSADLLDQKRWCEADLPIVAAVKENLAEYTDITRQSLR